MGRLAVVSMVLLLGFLLFGSGNASPIQATELRSYAQSKPQPTAGCIPSGQQPKKCPTFTPTPTDTPTNTPVEPTNTPTDTPTNTPVEPSNTPTDTPTNTPTDTPTNTPAP